VKTLSAPRLLTSVPGLAQQFREVPDGYWKPHGDGAVLRLARPAVPAKVKVSCVCGNRPVVRYGQLVGCRDRAACPHRCGRFFMWTGERVLAAGPQT
jgi:hypothetical protein